MRKLVLATCVLRAISPSSVSACAECAAGVRAQVRQGIYGAGFGFNLFATALPFGIFLGTSALIHFGFAPGRLLVRSLKGRS